MSSAGVQVLVDAVNDSQLKTIGNNIITKQRILFEEGVYLFEHASLSFVGALANWLALYESFY